MSAAPVLPSVWASTARRVAPEQVRREPIETLAFYRKHTEALLRRYMKKSFDIGRTPSILGNCMFRGRVSSRQLHTWEDTAIFLIDIEKCLQRLDKFSQNVLARIALQEYSQGETAALTGLSLRSIVRKYSEALDKLTAIFLEYELLSIDGGNFCQGGKFR